MHLPSSYLLPTSLWNTFRHTDLYENKGKRWGEEEEEEEPLESWKLNFALQLNGSEKRNTSCPFLLQPVTFCNYLSQRQSNVFDNKFNESIFVFTLRTAWNNLFPNLIQRQSILCDKTKFCETKNRYFYFFIGFGILSIARGNGRLIFAVVFVEFKTFVS